MYDKELKLNCVKQNDGNRNKIKIINQNFPSSTTGRLINKWKSLRILFVG